MDNKIHDSGIYFYLNKELEVLYIGKDSDICCETRHKSHLNRDVQLIDKYLKINDEWKYHKVIENNDIELNNLLEKILISYYKPVFNISIDWKKLQKWHALEILKLEKYGKKIFSQKSNKSN